MADDVEIALTHEDAVVRADEDRAEGMMAVHGGLACHVVGGTQMGDHPVAGHWSCSSARRSPRGLL